MSRSMGLRDVGDLLVMLSIRNRAIFDSIIDKSDNCHCARYCHCYHWYCRRFKHSVGKINRGKSERNRVKPRSRTKIPLLGHPDELSWFSSSISNEKVEDWLYESNLCNINVLIYSVHCTLQLYNMVNIIWTI